MELKDAIDLITDGNCVLFTGAGASIGAKNVHGEKIKPAFDLTEMLFDLCGSPSNHELSDSIDEFIEKFGQFKLIDLLKEQYTVSEIGSDHVILGSLPWKRVYTTNYDRVLEMGFAANKKACTPVTMSDRLYHFKDKSRVCVHLNGHIDRLNIDTLASEFRLSDTSYLVTADFLQNEWISLFKNDLAVCDAIFFIGFSLKYDLDLKRVIYGTAQQKAKSFFIMKPGETEANLKPVRKFGGAFPIGLEGFAEAVKRNTRERPANTVTEMKFHCFVQPRFDEVPRSVKDIDFYNLLFAGRIDRALLQFSLFNPQENPYFVQRDENAALLESVAEGHRNFLILSDLGNGKTMFANGVKLSLKAAGYSVFEFDRYYDTLDRELEEICTRYDKAAILVENYGKNLEVIQKLKLFNSDLVLIASERNLVNDLYQPRLEDCVGGEFIVFDLNLLSEEEIFKIIDLLDKYGLFGELAAHNRDRKRQHIARHCHNTFREILVDRLRSENIISKFRSIVDAFQTRRYYSDAVTLILVSRLFDFRLELDDLTYIFPELLSDRDFTKNTGVREFVDFYRQEITVTSSVLAEVLLIDVMNPTDIVSTMVKVCRRLNARREDRNIRNILRSVVSFSSMQRILRKDISSEYKYSLLNFFEEIKDLEFCNRNPHFWLQYAIARLSERDYAIADSYFETAYGYAKFRPTFDTYQIDNHFARHILENEIYNGDKSNCMSQFLKAHKILSNPDTDNKIRHYPYKVARNYFPFYERFFADLNEQDQLVLLRCCQEMIKRIEEYLSLTSDRQVRRDVLEAKKGIEEILKREAKRLS